MGKLAVLALGLLIFLSIAFLGRQRFDFSAPRWFLALGGVYIVWVLLANLLFSPYRSYTLLGWPGWNSGALFQVGLVTLFLLAATVRDRCPDEQIVRLLRRFLFGATLAVSALSVAEALGFSPFVGSRWMTWFGVVLTEPTFPAPMLTVGNSGWLAGLFVLLIPAPLLAYRHRWYGVWTLALAAGLASTHSKAAVLALVGVHGLLLAGWVLRRSLFGSRLFPLWSAAAILVGLAAWPIMQSSNRWLYDTGLAPRLNQNFAVDRENFTGSQTARLIIYASTLSQWRERPLTGWGLDTLHERFYEHLSPAQNRVLLAPLINPNTQSVEYRDGINMVYTNGEPKRFVRTLDFNVIRPHNALLEELYSHGLIGFVLMGTLLLGTAATIVRHGDHTDRVLLLCGVVYFFYLLLWFTTLAVTPLAAVLLGTALNSSLRARHEKKAQHRPARPPILS